MEVKIDPRHAKLLEKYKAIDVEDKEKWIREIELLERRVKTNFVDINLGNGDMIAIRASISDAEAGYIAKLDRERLKLNPEKDENQLNALTYEILAIVTANPIMTKEWFYDERERYSTEDMLKVILGYYDGITQRVRRVRGIKEFRSKSTGN